MTDKIIEGIVSAFTKELVSQSREIFNDLYDEGKHFIGTALKKYLEKQETKYSKIKTLLHGNMPVYLYDIYYPINLVSGSKIIYTKSIVNIFKQSDFVTIIGDAGSGKSTLIKHLFLNSIKEKYGIPILVELRYLNDTDGDIEKYIIEKIFENKLSENPKILERLLLNGNFVFFLDGYDELNSEIKNKVLKNLNSFINQYTDNKFILTSRPYSNIENLSLFQNLKIKELDNKKGEINNFVDLQLNQEQELAEKIKKSLKENKSQYIQSFLKNPLLLTLYILTFQTNAEIPDKKYIFYRRVINALFSEHDSKTKVGYVRQKQSHLSQEQFEEVLKAFCFLSYFESKFDFDFDYITETLKNVKTKMNKFDFETNKFVNDLNSAIALWTEDNGIYGFAHRSLQEYFAALFVKNLNTNDKERAYKKIIAKFSSERRSGSAVENFLSLCKEMDEINFLQFYYLPLLEELNQLVDIRDEKSMITSTILFFTDGFIVDSNREHQSDVIIKDVVYKTIFVHIEHTRVLYRILNQISDNEVIRNHKDLKDYRKKSSKILLLKNNIPEDVSNLLCNNEELKDFANKFHRFISYKLHETKKTISESINRDKELLDLI